MERAVTPAPVPLSGFRNLSAVSKQARVLRPCFVPQPSLGTSLQSFPLVESAAPLSEPLLPCRYPPTCRSALPGALSPPVSPTPPLSRGRLVPPPAMGALSAIKSENLPVALGPLTTEPLHSVRFTDFEASFPLRVRSRWFGLPLASGRSSPGFFPL
jgi:hypothetical protein